MRGRITEAANHAGKELARLCLFVWGHCFLCFTCLWGPGSGSEGLCRGAWVPLVQITFILGVPGVVLQDHEDVLAFAFGKAVASSNAPKPKTVAYVGRV